MQMHLQLRDQQLKTILYMYRIPYQNFRVTAKKTLQLIHTQRKKNTLLKIVIKTQEQRTREEGKKKEQKNSKTTNNMEIRTNMPIITLNVNYLNAPTKIHRLSEWIQKQDPYICCLQETHFTSRDTYNLKVRGWKKILHAKGNQN